MDATQYKRLKFGNVSSTDYRNEVVPKERGDGNGYRRGRLRLWRVRLQSGLCGRLRDSLNIESKMYSVVQLNFTPEIVVF